MLFLKRLLNRGSPINYPSSSKKSFSLSILYLSLIFSFIGCSRQKPTQAVLGKHCLKKMKAYFKRKPIALLETRFFKDRKSHNILNVRQIKLKSMRELNSSATISSYILHFDFENQKGEQVTLHNSEKTGGISLRGPNLITYQISCKIQWNLFKSKVTNQRINMKQVNLETWAKEMQQMTEGVKTDQWEMK